MDKKNNWKAWLYLLPALVLMVVFMLYPLIDVFVYSFEEEYNSVTREFTGYGFYNYVYVLSDPSFITSLRNTFLVVIITVPLSTIISLVMAVALNSIKPLQKLFQTIFFTPYVTNVLAIGMVFLIMFQTTSYTQGLFNIVLKMFGLGPVDWIEGPYWAKLFVLCFYIIWTVIPFKIIVLVGALQSVNKQLYDAALVDHASRWKTFRSVTVPMISPIISYLVITGFIGAFKVYSETVAIFGSGKDLLNSNMQSIVGYIYINLYSATGGYPSYASAAAIVLFCIVLTITVINTLVSNKYVHY